MPSSSSHLYATLNELVELGREVCPWQRRRAIRDGCHQLKVLHIAALGGCVRGFYERQVDE